MFGTLRTLLAFNVVLLHIFNVPALGNYSVSFFFLLSGFLMTFIMHETYGYSVKGFRVYWLNRMLRLYPVYFVIILLTVFGLLLFPNVIKHPDLFFPTSAAEWMANITMIFPEIVPHRFEPRLVPPSWALTNELLFYLLISFGISKTWKRTVLWLLVSVAYYVGTYLYYDIATYRYGAIFASSLPFAMGAGLYWLNKSFPLKKAAPIWVIIFYLLFIGNAMFGPLFNQFFLKDASIYLNLIIAFFLVYLLFNVKSTRSFKRVDTYIGYYSYPIYLSHYLAAIIYSGTIGYGVIKGSFKMNPSAFALYVLVLMLICGVLVHLVDIRVDKYKKQIKAAQLSGSK